MSYDNDYKPIFSDWYKECDKIVTGILGLGVDDLPDAQWMDYYHDDMTPFEAVDTANIDYWPLILLRF